MEGEYIKYAFYEERNIVDRISKYDTKCVLEDFNAKEKHQNKNFCCDICFKMTSIEVPIKTSNWFRLNFSCKLDLSNNKNLVSTSIFYVFYQNRHILHQFCVIIIQCNRLNVIWSLSKLTRLLRFDGDPPKTQYGASSYHFYCRWKVWSAMPLC